MVSSENPATLDAGDPGLTTPFPLEKLSYTRTGIQDAPAVLVMHGWGSSAALMAPLATALSTQYDVFNLDLPGHGNTPPPATPIGVPEYATVVHHFIDEIIGRPVSVVGHSNGGRIGLYMSGEPGMSHLIERLALVSPSGIKPTRSLSWYIKTGTAKTLKAPFIKLPEPLRSHGLRWVRGTFIWQALGSSDYKSVTGVMRDVFIKTVSFFVEDRLGDITCPTLLIWGNKDTAVAENQMRTLEAGIANSRLIVLEGAGHYAFIDQPETVFSSILQFLNSSE